MTVGIPFQRGRQKTGGRQKGTKDKNPKLPLERLNNRIRRHVDRSMERHEQGIDKIADPAEALKIDARFNRDLVELLRYSSQAEETQRGSEKPSKEIEAEARRRGPITDEEAMLAYFHLCKGDAGDEARITMERAMLGQREQLPEVLRDCRALRHAIAAGRIKVRGEVGLAELLRELDPPEPQARVPARAQEPTPAEDLETLRYRGVPTGEPGHSLITRDELARERPDPHPEPPAPPRTIDVEPPIWQRGPTGARPLSEWDDVTVVMGGGFAPG